MSASGSDVGVESISVVSSIVMLPLLMLAHFLPDYLLDVGPCVIS